MSIQPSPRHGGKDRIGGDLKAIAVDLARADDREVLTSQDIGIIMDTTAELIENVGFAVSDIYEWAARAWRSRDGGHDETMAYCDALMDVLDRIQRATEPFKPGLVADLAERSRLDEADEELWASLDACGDDE